MVTCPKCGSEECKKDGIVKGRQRHKCKSCKTSAGYRLLLIDMGKRFINCVLGDRGTATGKQLWGAIKDTGIGKIATDHLCHSFDVKVERWLASYAKLTMPNSNGNYRC
jgi:IS1 family transposase